MESLPVYVLAGGRSSRFGEDKARATLRGEPLIRWAVRPLEDRASSLTVVAGKSGEYSDLGFRTLGDLEPGLGPLGGLATALHDRIHGEGEGWLFITSCDFVGAREQWVDRLLAHRTQGARAVAFRGSRWEPLFALYHTSALGAVEAVLERGRGAAHALLDAVSAIAVPVPEDWSEARSVNTPEDLESITRRETDAG